MEENTDDASIQYEIGLCYLNGDGTEKDTAEAEKWLTRAANQGHEQAKALLESGNHGTPEEPAETDILELCMKAEDGDKDAQYAAARYFMAHGMAQTEADRYLKAAADQGNGQACDELGESLLQQSINCANQNDRFEKEKQAVRYFKNALDCGIPHAAERLADCYLNARGSCRTTRNRPRRILSRPPSCTHSRESRWRWSSWPSVTRSATACRKATVRHSATSSARKTPVCPMRWSSSAAM